MQLLMLNNDTSVKNRWNPEVSNLFDSVCPYFDNWGLEFGSIFLLLWFACLSVCTVESYYSLLDMNCLSWNCRGIGNSRTVRALHNLVQQYNPNIVFLMETKIGAKRMVKVRERIGLPNGLILPSEGKSGGMALLWAGDLDVEIKSFSRHHIDAIVIDPKTGFKWRITSFYGNSKTSLRKESWSLLQFLKSQYQMPWMCLGDFNEIVSTTEKPGGPSRAQQQMEGFRKAIDFCGFQDMGYEGPKFTWCNQRPNEGRIQLRLDRVLVTVEWAEYYQNARVFHIV